MSKFKGWKTVTFGILAMLGGAAQANGGLLTPGQAGVVMTVIGALAIILRAVTDTPLGQGTPKA